jgi:hypothetical protein
VWLREATSVYIFNRGNMPMLVFDPDGNLIDAWGNDTLYAGMTEIADPYGVSWRVWEGVRFMWPHSVRVDPNDDLWLVDARTYTMTKTDRTGKTLMTIGTGEAAPRQSGKPVNRAADVAVPPANGDIFISDGCGNSRVHCYDRDARYVLSWGELGSDHGQFSLPHHIAMVDDDHVIVGDRESHRVQVSTVEGEFVRSWHVHRAVAVVRGRGDDGCPYSRSRARRPWSSACRTWGTASRCARPKASWSRGSVRRCPARRPSSSSGRTASPRTRAANSTWRRCRTWKWAAGSTRRARW